MTSPDVLGSGGRAADPAPDTAPALPTGRNIELVLLAFAAAIVTAALVLVEANQENELTRSLVYVGAAYLGLFTVAHFAVRKLAPYADPVMLPCVALLNGLGLVMIHRLDLAAADRAVALGREAPTVLIQRQVAWTAIGLVLFVGVLYFVRNHRTLARYGYTAGFAGLILLALPGLLPSSISEVNGARIWLRLGIFSIQPGEFAKILLIVFFAVFLMQKRELFSEAGRRFLGMEFPRARDLAPLLIAWGLSVGVLVLERDLGTSLLFFGLFVAMLYVATQRFSWIAIGLVLFAAGAYLAYRIFDHVQQRVELWLDPFSQASLEQSDQLAKGIMGMASGGLFGTGLGQGRPWLVAFSNSDFIFASFGEELGLFGVAALLALYAVFVERGFRTALGVRDGFGKLLAFGLAFSVGLQVFVVIGGVTKVIPLTGLTTPFMSLGGSSLLANWALMAILLRISDQARRPVTDDVATPDGRQERPADNATEVVAMP